MDVRRAVSSGSGETRGEDESPESPVQVYVAKENDEHHHDQGDEPAQLRIIHPLCFLSLLVFRHTYAAMSNHLEFVALVALWVLFCVVISETLWRIVFALAIVVYLVLRCWLTFRETRNSWSVYSNPKRD